MPKCSSPKTLDRIRARLRDLYRNHGEEIERGNFIPQVSSIVFKEFQWLVNELDAMIAGEVSKQKPLTEAETEAPAPAG